MADDALIQLIERSGAIDPQLLARARARTETILTALVLEGGTREEVLRAGAAAWGMLPAMRAVLDAPAPTDLSAATLAELAAVPAAPLGITSGVLHLAVTSPFAYEQLDKITLPGFRTYLALEDEVHAVLRKVHAEPGHETPAPLDIGDPFVRMAKEAKLNAASAYGYDTTANLEAARESLLFGYTDDGSADEFELDLYMDSRARVPVLETPATSTPAPVPGGVLELAPSGEPAPEVVTSSPDLASGAWGRLRDVRVSELVQMLTVSGASGQVDVRLDIGLRGSVAVKGGEVWAAELGTQKGEAAFFSLCRALDGRFLMSAFPGLSERQIKTPTQALLVEALRASYEGAPTAAPEVQHLSGIFLEDIEAEFESTQQGAAPELLENLLESQSFTSQLNLSAPDTNLGKMVGNYRILEEVGKGATAIVYRAQASDSDEVVALKVLSERSVKDDAFLRRFKREVRTHAALNHENILHVRDFGRVDETFFLVLDFMPRTLEHLLAAGPAPGAVVALVLHDSLKAVAAAHARGVVHRDLKPSNVLLSDAGAVRVADFGLARNELDPNRSSTGAIVGTPAYMSPEQALGQPIDGRSDLFALGSIAYELLTGVCRFARQTAPMSLMAVCQGTYTSLFELAPAVPPRLEEVVSRLSARNPEERYESAEAALQALSPLVASIKLRYPDILVRYGEDPATAGEELRNDQANQEMARGRQLVASGDESLRPQAALAFLRAERLSRSREPSELFDKLAAQAGYCREPPADQQLLALVAKLQTDPTSRPTLRRAALLASNLGALATSVAYLLRYLQIAPTDAAVRAHVATLLGADARIPFEWTAPEHKGRAAGTPSQPIAALREESNPKGVASPPKSDAAGGGRGKIVAASIFVLAVLAVGVLFLPEIIGTGTSESAGTLTPIRPGLSPAEASRAHLENGRVQLAVGAHKNAILSFDAALQGEPGLSTEMETRLLRARCYAALGQRDAAENDLKVVIRVLDAVNPIAVEAAADLAKLPKR